MNKRSLEYIKSMIRLALIYIFLSFPVAYCATLAEMRENTVDLESDIDQMLNLKTLKCYRTNRNFNLTFQNQTFEGTRHASIEIMSPEGLIKIRVSESWGRVRKKVEVFLENDLIHSYRIRIQNTEFMSDGIGLREEANNFPQRLQNILSTVNCSYGETAFTYKQDENDSFLIVNHLQQGYLSLGVEEISNYFESYLQFDWSNKNVIVGLDARNVEDHFFTTSISSYREGLEYNTERSWNNVLLGANQNYQVRLLSIGNFHLSLPSDFNQEISIIGAYLNYCITNNLISIGRELISSQLNEVTVRLHMNYIFLQIPGIIPSLNLPITPNIYANTLSRDLLNQFFEAQKNYIERTLSRQIEVLFPDQVPKGHLPKLRIIPDYTF